MRAVVPPAGQAAEAACPGANADWSLAEAGAVGPTFQNARCELSARERLASSRPIWRSSSTGLATS